MSKTIPITWEVGDGYAGKSRPQRMQLDLDDYRGLETRQGIREQIEGDLHEEFLQNITAEITSHSMDELIDLIAKELASDG